MDVKCLRLNVKRQQGSFLGLVRQEEESRCNQLTDVFSGKLVVRLVAPIYFLSKSNGKGK